MTAPFSVQRWVRHAARQCQPLPAIADALYAARLFAEDEPAAPVRIIIFGSFVTVGEALEVFAKEGLRR